MHGLYFTRAFSSTIKFPRVVVTGMGIVCPLGVGIQNVWPDLCSGRVGTTALDHPDYADVPCKVAALVPKGSGEGQLTLSDHFKSSEMKAYSTATKYGLIAAQEALRDANWHPQTDYDCHSTGTAVGIGMVDLTEITQEHDRFVNRGYNKLSPYFIPKILSNLTAGHISIKFGFRGPNHCVSTACAAGGHSIGDAFNFIRLGYASVMLCGASEAVISPLSIAAFSKIRALSTNFNNSPKTASRPFDDDRDGFVMGEGAGMLVLESLEHAKERGARIYAEVLGYGLSGDAYQVAAPPPDGSGALSCMYSAIENSGVAPQSISHVNAHATSTPIGDAIELEVIKSIFGYHCKNVLVTSTKGATGHLMGAAGSIEAIFTVLACNSGLVPPTCNLENCSINGDIQIVRKQAMIWHEPTATRIAISNSFGFGGTNASLIFKNFSEDE